MFGFDECTAAPIRLGTAIDLWKKIYAIIFRKQDQLCYSKKDIVKSALKQYKIPSACRKFYTIACSYLEIVPILVIYNGTELNGKWYCVYSIFSFINSDKLIISKINTAYKNSHFDRLFLSKLYIIEVQF